MSLRKVVWNSTFKNGTIRPKTYEELSDKEKIQADCDLKATNIVLQGLPPDVYALVNHHKVTKDIWDRFKLLMQGTSLSKQERKCKLYDEFDKFSYVKGETLHQYYLRLPPEWGKFVTDVKLARDLHTSNYDQLYAYLEQHERQAEFPQIDSGLAIPTFLPGDDPIACMNKAMAFLLPVFTPCSQGNTSGSRGNTSGQVKVIKCYNFQGEGHMARQCTQPKRRRDASWFKEKVLFIHAQAEGKELDEEQLAFLADPGVADGQVAQTITHNASFQTDDLDAYDFECDDISSAKAVLMANFSSCDSYILYEVPYSDISQSYMMNQSVHEFQYSELSPIVDYPDNEITSDSNIIPYSQYLEETQQAIVQNTNTYGQQNSMILSVFEQMSNHATNWNKANNESKIVNESLPAELERYTERFKILEQRFNVDLSSHEKFIDSQMDDMIRMKNTKFVAFEMEIDTLK
ncbi:retrovirus-related pol polyprotein from transposon TNT 1-94 [Tanacetum coccineum]